MTSRERKESRSAALAPESAALLAVVAVAWGGATTYPAQIAVLAGLGLLWLLAPARRIPDKGFLISAGGLIALAATAWLPAAWFAVEPWRRILQSAGIHLATTHSPQPWLSAEAMLWLVAGLGWVAWLMGQRWNSATRTAAARTLAGGIALIAAAALTARALHLAIPGWLSEPLFGPFPNRNHTGHVFALGGTLALGCAADAWRRDRKKALPWFIAAGIILVALVVNFSRGGVLLFFGAMLFWAALAAWQRKSWKTLSVGASLVFVLIAVVLMGGGATASRFAGGADSEVAFRFLIWRDTLALIHASPWCGTGLGNFTSLFPFFRNASVIQQGVLHPESDWLWLAVELGWLGVAFALGAAFFALRGAFPFAPGTGRRLRGAALAAAVAAILHCAIDVPEHRLGAALCALMVMALARVNPQSAADSRLAAAIFRSLGIIALGAAIRLAQFDDEAHNAESLLHAGHFAEAQAAADRALARAPLDWGAYFTRAGALACRRHPLEAVADFRRARTLEPQFAGVPLEEGRFWLPIQPALSLVAWREALRRVPPPQDEETFDKMLDAAPNNPAFRAQLLALVEDRPALQVQWFRYVPDAEAREHLAAIAAAAQNCSPEQREAFQRRADSIRVQKAP